MTRKQIIAAVILTIVAIVSVVGFLLFTPARITHRATDACRNNLRQIEGAKQQWQIENKQITNAVPTWNEIGPYIGRESAGDIPQCPKGGTYTLGRMNEKPRCSCGASLSE